ncbi:MAG: ATP synthase F0 subunit A [Chitinophagaceae bacterium]|nr:MAG: ATP synthase F0 subunit A [Chitinophagaceae bacterium]
MGWIFKIPVLTFMFLMSTLFIKAEQPEIIDDIDGTKSSDFDITYLIESKIIDDYQWHIIDIGERKIYLYLPVILIGKTDQGWRSSVFMSSKFDHGKNEYAGYRYNKGKIESIDGHTFYDISITKNVLSLFFVVLIMCLIFISVAKTYKNRVGMAPKGFQSLIEPIIIFVRDDIVKNSIGEKKYRKFLPYLLTLFFFIWINNLLGLVPIFPGKANVTGNIAVTLTLATLTLIVTNFNGTKAYWSHILWPPGIPIPIKIPLAVVEFIGIFTKPFALMIRLFANITAGQILMMSIFGLIFLLAPAMSTGGALGLSIGTVLFAVFMNILKLVVAFLQAFIFTLLSSIFIGQAVEEGHH